MLISDSVETFSIGSILTLKKEVKSKKEEVEKLTNDNRELRTQIISIMATSITNQNRNQVFLDLGEEWMKNAKVEEVIKDDSEGSGSAECSDENPSESMGTVSHQTLEQRMRFRRYIEKDIIKKFADKNDIASNMVQYDVKFSLQFSGGDPIMEQVETFDAYIKRPFEELFVEAINGSSSKSTYYRIYYIISLVVRYAQVNNKAAKLILLMPKYTDDWVARFYGESRVRSLERDIQRLQMVFQPALKNGFLEIKYIDYSEKECAEIESIIAKCKVEMG